MRNQRSQVAATLLVFLATCLPASAQLLPQVTKKPKKKEVARRLARIVVETQPSAQVYLDGEYRGQASSQGRLVIENVKPGNRTVKVSLAGHQGYYDEFTIGSGQVATIEATLKELPGTIRVQTSADATVYLDNSRAGTADPSGGLVFPDVPVGRHEVRISARGKQDYRQTVTVLAGQESRIGAALADLTGSIRVETSPSAAVYLDEISQGTADGSGVLVIPKVSPGTHELRISATGKKEQRESLTVVAGQESTVTAGLVAAPGGGSGSLRIHTSPGAEVYVDLVYRGRADSSGQALVSDIGPGRHEVVISPPGQQASKRTIRVEAGATEEINGVAWPPSTTTKPLTQGPEQGVQRFSVSWFHSMTRSLLTAHLSSPEGYLTISGGRIKLDLWKTNIDGKKVEGTDWTEFDVPVEEVRRVSKGNWHGFDTVELWLRNGKRYTLWGGFDQMIQAIQAAREKK